MQIAHTRRLNISGVHKLIANREVKGKDRKKEQNEAKAKKKKMNSVFCGRRRTLNNVVG